MSESGFFLSQLHRILVGIREFQAKSGDSRRDSPLACPLFHCFGTQYGGRDVTWKRPMHLDTWWHHLATLLDLMMISHYILYISMYAVLIVLLFCDVTTQTVVVILSNDVTIMMLDLNAAILFSSFLLSSSSALINLGSLLSSSFSALTAKKGKKNRCSKIFLMSHTADCTRDESISNRR